MAEKTLLDYSLQAMDCFEVEMIMTNADGSKTVIGTGETLKSEITQKVDKVEVRNGIGMQKRATFKTKKENGLKTTVNQFNLDIFAAKNGVKLDKTSKKTIFWFVPTEITTNTATIADASRILAVKTLAGKRFDIITTGTPTVDQVLVEGTKLTFATEFKDSQVLACYEGTTTKDNLTIVFSSKEFSKSVELLCHSVVYAEETEDVIADVYYDFYQASMLDDYTLTFDGGKVADTELDFEINTPNVLPDGTYNKDGVTGHMYVTQQ